MTHLNIRQIMDCTFTLCHVHDTVEEAVRKMVNDQTSYAVAIDGSNTYQGVITAGALLAVKGDGMLVQDVMWEIEPLKEEDPVTEIRPGNAEIIPVVNRMKSVAGVISIRSVFQYLPEALSGLDTARSSGLRRAPQLSAKYTINDIVGHSKAILLLKEQIIAAAKTRSTVMLLGETGTGKELAAHAIHRLSSRRHNAFVRVNCAAIPDSLLESELFGYEPGAFTGAVKGGQIGKFEAADGVTLFLDEIGDMPFSLQSKILRVLQEKEIEKIGGRAPIAIDVRIIAATHRNLRELVREQKFREDLYYRLHVIPIQLPPLRAHREDIPLLVDFFLTKQAAEMDIDKPDTDHDFMARLIEYDWPGNVRELANIVELAVSMSRGTITKEVLPPLSPHCLDEEAAGLRSYADEAEKEAIIKALEVFGGNKIKVCDALGISRSSLYNKLKKYNIEG